MSTMDEREKGYERKFQQDQEFAFKVKARRNKLLGLWAAERLGLVGEPAETYARELVATGLEHLGDADVVAKLLHDFTAKGAVVDATRVELEFERCFAEARRQLGAPR